MIKNLSKYLLLGNWLFATVLLMGRSSLVSLSLGLRGLRLLEIFLNFSLFPLILSSRRLADKLTRLWSLVTSLTLDFELVAREYDRKTRVDPRDGRVLFIFVSGLENHLLGLRKHLVFLVKERHSGLNYLSTLQDLVDVHGEGIDFDLPLVLDLAEAVIDDLPHTTVPRDLDQSSLCLFVFFNKQFESIRLRLLRGSSIAFWFLILVLLISAEVAGPVLASVDHFFSVLTGVRFLEWHWMSSLIVTGRHLQKFSLVKRIF